MPLVRRPARRGPPLAAQLARATLELGELRLRGRDLGGLGAAERLARLVLAADHVSGVQDFGCAAQVRVLVERGLDPLLVADQRKK